MFFQDALNCFRCFLWTFRMKKNYFAIIMWECAFQFWSGMIIQFNRRVMRHLNYAFFLSLHLFNCRFRFPYKEGRHSLFCWLFFKWSTCNVVLSRWATDLCIWHIEKYSSDQSILISKGVLYQLFILRYTVGREIQFS